MKTNAMEKLVNENFIREITPLSDEGTEKVLS